VSSRFYEILDAMAKRPGMYLGEQSITILSGWVAGWCSALDDPFEGTEPPFREFHDWVALRLGFFESTSGWRLMLLKTYEGDEVAAFRRFFELFDEFRTRKARVIFAADADKTRKPADRKDRDEIKVVPWPQRLEIVSYNEDPGVFVWYIDQSGKTYLKFYSRTLENAFRLTEGIVRDDEWIKTS
jgi:hypothetical protein